MNSGMVNITLSHICGMLYLPKVIVKGRIVDPYAGGFFDGSSEVMLLYAYYVEDLH